MPAIDPQVINGHDGLKCGGEGLVIAGGMSLDFQMGDFAIGVVFTSASGLWGENGGLSIGTDTSGNYAFNINGVGRVVIPEMNPGGWHALIARGAAMDLLMDWGQSSTGPTSDAGITTSGGGSLGLCNAGEVAEYVAVKGKLSDADRTSLMAYFKAKYKL